MMKSDGFRRVSLGTVLLVLVAGTLISSGLFGADPARSPCLTAPQALPYNSNEKVFYRFSVRYFSADHSLPKVIQVFVDDKAYTLTTKSKAGYDAVYMSDKMQLEAGAHRYYFYVEDGRGLDVRSPRYGEWSGPYVGRSWRKCYNSWPVLSDGHLVQGDVGDEQSYFTYSVHFGDADSNAPRYVRVMIDGLPHDMKLLKGTPARGTYTYSTYLDTAPHAYYFTARDHCGACVSFPEKGFIRGPQVGEIPNSNPELYDGKCEPSIGGLCDKFLYRVRYLDAEMDPPSVIQVYVNGFPHNMKLYNGKPYDGVYIYQATTTLGNFNKFYYRAEDGRGGEAMEPVTGYSHGPVVVNQK